MIEQIAIEIKSIRKELGLTQQEMADRIGINKCTYANYEVARAMPPADNYIKILSLRPEAQEAA